MPLYNLIFTSIMGKRPSRSQGIGRFVFEAFNNNGNEASASMDVALTSTPTTTMSMSTAVVAVTKAELPHAHWVPKYDATGLVPHYTEEDKIPKHLEKCAQFSCSRSSKASNMHRLLPA